ncbi:MAG: hypothetical protein JWL95_3243 [Gemmatimonadetes bacterium]|nr:hypothetical protein [Gemmatimonadota bacterium]
MKRKKRKNPTGGWDVAGAVAAFVIPIGSGMLAQSASQNPAVAVTLMQGEIIVGGLLGAAFSAMGGFGNPSFSRGYAVASGALVAAGLVSYAVNAATSKALPAAATP